MRGSMRAGGGRPGFVGVEHLRRHGTNFAAGIRMCTLVPTGVVALSLSGEVGSRSTLVVVVTALAVWSVVYSAALRWRPNRFVTAADSVVLAGVGLMTSHIVPADWVLTGKSWMVPFVSFAGAAYQYSARPLAGALAAGVATGGMVVGTLLVGPVHQVGPTLRTALWGLVVAALGRVLWACISRGGVLADRAAAEADQARRARDLAAAGYDDESEHRRLLHDTASATLLMVGTGDAARDAAMVAVQAHRDLSAVLAGSEPPLGLSDLTAAVRDVVGRTALQIRFAVPPGPTPVPARVTAAFLGAVEEALRNVHRHADSTTCLISLSVKPESVVLTVSDDGAGFDLDLARTGHGIAWSIVDRMSEVGGAASIRSEVGSGTTVALRWPA